jgi:hypothetical protein
LHTCCSGASHSKGRYAALKLETNPICHVIMGVASKGQLVIDMFVRLRAKLFWWPRRRWQGHPDGLGCGAHPWPAFQDGHSIKRPLWPLWYREGQAKERAGRHTTNGRNLRARRLASRVGKWRPSHWRRVSLNLETTLSQERLTVVAKEAVKQSHILWLAGRPGSKGEAKSHGPPKSRGQKITDFQFLVFSFKYFISEDYMFYGDITRFHIYRSNNIDNILWQ